MPRPRACLCLALVLAGLAGCSSAPEPVVNADEARPLRQIHTAYSAARRALHRPPANLGELLPFLKKAGDPDTLLRSPRDGLPYVILWKVDPAKTQRMPPPIIAYEQNGAEGKHYVLTVMGVMTMTDEELAKELQAK